MINQHVEIGLKNTNSTNFTMNQPQEPDYGFSASSIHRSHEHDEGDEDYQIHEQEDTDDSAIGHDAKQAIVEYDWNKLVEDFDKELKDLEKKEIALTEEFQQLSEVHIFLDLA